MKDYFLTRTSHEDLEMFRSIMDLPREEAEYLTKTFTNKSSHRGSYYDHRLEVETWLRTQAQAANVAITHDHPLYFFLTPQPEHAEEGAGIVTISLPVTSIDLNFCSFTIEDSFCNHEFIRTGGQDSLGVSHPLLGRVFNAAQLEDAIREHGILDYLARNKESYIEVQLWGRTDPAP